MSLNQLIPTNAIHTFWYNPSNGNKLPLQEVACVMSWMRQNKQVYFWTYEKIDAPELHELASKNSNFHLMDANEVISRTEYFVADYSHIGAHGFAMFSDLFRYAVVNDFGGWWLDSDFILLNDTRILEDIESDNSNSPKAWLGQWSLSRKRNIINNGAIYCRKPGMLQETYDICVEEVARTKELMSSGKAEEIIWGNTGPTMITDMKANDEHSYEIGPIQDFYLIDCYAYTGSLPIFAHTEAKADDVVGFFAHKPVGIHLWNSYLHKSGGIFDKSFFGIVIRLALQDKPINATNVIQEMSTVRRFIDLSVPNHNVIQSYYEL